MNKRKALEKQKKEILGYFDFDSCHEIMAKTGWSWGLEGIPSKDEIKKEAIRLMDDVIEDGGGWSGTGGLLACTFNGKGSDGPWIKMCLAFGEIADVHSEQVYTKKAHRHS